MFTTFCYKAAKCNAKGLAPVILRITIAGERADFSTGVRCAPENWDNKRARLKATHPAYSAHSELLKKLDGDAATAKQRIEASPVRENERQPGSQATAREVAEYLRDPNRLRAIATPICFLSFCEQEVATHYAPRNYGTYNSIKQAVSRLREWHGPKPLLITDFGPAKAAAFYTWLLDTARAAEHKGAAATAACKLRWLTALYNRGRKQRLFLLPTSPFESVSKEKEPKRAKPRLQVVELQEFAAFKLPPSLALARDIYLLQFYLRGERIGATLQLRRANYDPTTGKLRWQAEKRGPEKEAILHPEARRILASFKPVPGSPYLLPLLPADYEARPARNRLTRRTCIIRHLNEDLAEVARRIGLPEGLRTHSARHTFANIADEATGNNARAIQKMLGHSNLRTTEVYLADLTGQQLDAAAATVYDSLL
jgi:integrase